MKNEFEHYDEFMEWMENFHFDLLEALGEIMRPEEEPNLTVSEFDDEINF